MKWVRQVEVIAHEDEAQNVDPVDLAGSLETLQEGGRVAAEPHDLLTRIAPAGHMQAT